MRGEHASGVAAGPRRYPSPSTTPLSRSVQSPVPAYLPAGLLDRLRASLDSGTVLACASVSALIAAAVAAHAHIVIVDPVLCGSADSFSHTLSHALGRCVPIVLYTHATSTAVRPCFAWAGAGASHLLLAGIDDDAPRLRTFVDALTSNRKTEAFVHRLDERLVLVPAPLASAVRRLFVDFSTVPDLDALAMSCYMNRRSVDRWLQRAGLASPKQFLGAARLIRAHEVLACGEMNLARAATRAGFSSVRSLACHTRALLDAPASALRALCVDELYERVAWRLSKG